MANQTLTGHETVSQYGRLYGKYRLGQYMLPHDDTERDRLDVMHTMIKTARPSGKRLLHCPTEMLRVPRGRTPLGGQQPRVLDLGCGTGIWMLDMAKEYPGADFIGVDMHYMGPSDLLENVEIRAPWDYESPWALGLGSWDIVRLQMGLGSVSNWQGLLQKIIRHLVPGTGWFESVEIDFAPRCDDGTLKQGKLTEWWGYIQHHFGAANRPLHYNPAIYDMLRSVGFRDIQYVKYRLPMNGWVTDNTAEERSGMWWNIAMSPGHENTGGYGLEAMSLDALCRHSGWSPEHVRMLCADALRDASHPSIHAYTWLHIWWARAPGPDER